MDVLILEEPIRLFEIQKVLDEVPEYPRAPLRRELFGKVLSILESFVDRLAKHLSTLVLIGLLVPLLLDLVEAPPIHGAATHRARTPRRPLGIPLLNTSFTENVSATQFLEGTRFGEAHRALATALLVGPHHWSLVIGQEKFGRP